MAKRLTDDEVMDHVYRQLFGDLDGIEAHTLFDEDGEKAVEGGVANAAPESKESGGVKITIEPLMAGAVEGARTSTGGDNDGDEDDEEDKLRGIGGMSPLMAQLHGKR